MRTDLPAGPTLKEGRGLLMSTAVVLGGLAGTLEAQLTLLTGTMQSGEIGFNFAILAAAFGGAAWIWTMAQGLRGLGRVPGESALALIAILTFALRGSPGDHGGGALWLAGVSVGIAVPALALLAVDRRRRPSSATRGFVFISTAAMTLTALALAGLRDRVLDGSEAVMPVGLSMLVLGTLSSLVVAKQNWLANLFWTALLFVGTTFWAGFQVKGLEIEPAARKAPGSAPPGQSQPPNVILMVWDTVRADHLSLYGYPRRTSPNLDALAAESVVFDHAISSGNYSLTSHASLFTGLLPGQHGALPRFGKRLPSLVENAVGLSKDVETLASTLRGQGFTTGGASANFAYLAPWTGLQRGFDVFRAPPKRLLRYRPALASLRRHLLKPEPKPGDPEPWEGESVSVAGARFAAAAREPFFLFLNYFDAHDPYIARKGHVFLGDGLGSDTPSEANYDSEVAYVDSAVGELVRELRGESLLDRTILVITADHGEMFGEHGLSEHNRGAYEGILHVPLLVRYPKGFAPRRVQRPFGLYEVRRLILDLLGSRPTDWVDAGESEPRVLSEIWARKPPDDDLDAQGIALEASVVYMSPFKLINRGAGKNELYDLSKDPREEDNLLIQPARYRLLRQRMQAAIAKVPPWRPGDDGHATAVDIEALQGLGYISVKKPPQSPGAR